MILALDPGYAHCGWAIVTPRTARVVDLGVWTSECDSALDKSTDRARRLHTLSFFLKELRADTGCTVIAAESALSHGKLNAVLSQAMPWGALAMLAAVSGAELVEVRAKDWERAVVGGSGKIAYSAVERALASHVGDRLSHIKPRLHTHALDAVGVGLYCALRKVTRVACASSTERSTCPTEGGAA